MKLILLTILITFTTLISRAEEIHITIPFNQAIPVLDGHARAIAKIDLPVGDWIISGQINFDETVEITPNPILVSGTVGVNSISVSDPGTTAFNTTPMPESAILGIGIPSRLVEVRNGSHIGSPVPVYLIAFSKQQGNPSVTPLCKAWGFISARRLTP